MNVVDALEALLFASEAPTSAATLAKALEISEEEAQTGLEMLKERLDKEGAVRLVQIAGGYQLGTKPEFARIVADYLKPQRQKLGKSLMEVLAIVAYKQPVTIAEIDFVRGVQSDYSVKSLLERRLIQEVGRKEAPGRPIMYGTSQQFLHQFNLNDLSQLPDIQNDEMEAAAIVRATLPAE